MADEPLAAPPPEKWDDFLSRAAECRQTIERMKHPLIVNHYDCDGLTSGAIAAAFLESQGTKYRINTVRKVDATLLEQIKDEQEIIFTDLGGGQDGVQELKGEVVILDHHQVASKNKRLQLNPHLFGMDGGAQLCGATTAHWCLGTLPQAAIVGAVGDIQSPLQGANRILLNKLVKQGVVIAPIDLKLYGRMSRPLPQLLTYADDPYFPGLSGSEERCAAFLEGIGLGKGAEGKWKTYNDLANCDKKKLVGALAVYMTELGNGKFNASRLVGETYLFPNYQSQPELFEAGEFSTLMNACGRHEQPQLGIDICLGREGALAKGVVLLALHRRLLRDGVEFAYKNVRDWGAFLFLDGRGVIDDGIIGVVAGMLYPGGRQKPIVALAMDANRKIKVSTRGTRRLVAAGLNLGLALRQSCEPLGGAGGGHAIAAGASVPPERLDEFLKAFASAVERQIGGTEEIKQAGA